MVTHVKTFYNVTELLDMVASSQDAATHSFLPLHDNVADSLAPETFYGMELGRPLPQMLSDCRTLQGFQEAIRRIDTLASQAAAAIPALPTIRRQRHKGPSGYALNPHKVLRGDLAHAWTKMTRAHVPDGGRVARLILCGQFAGNVSANQIQWTMAAGLALASILEASGRRCEIWTMRVNEQIYGQDALRVATCLKGADEPWSTQNVALTADPAWGRRLHWRLAEMRRGLDTAYGIPSIPAWHAAVPVLAEEQGWDIASVLPGPTAHDGLTTEAHALHWLKRQAEPAGND